MHLRISERESQVQLGLLVNRLMRPLRFEKVRIEKNHYAAGNNQQG
jgi:hypothetical protein